MQIRPFYLHVVEHERLIQQLDHLQRMQLVVAPLRLMLQERLRVLQYLVQPSPLRRILLRRQRDPIDRQQPPHVRILRLHHALRPQMPVRPLAPLRGYIGVVILVLARISLIPSHGVHRGLRGHSRRDSRHLRPRHRQQHHPAHHHTSPPHHPLHATHIRAYRAHPASHHQRPIHTMPRTVSRKVPGPSHPLSTPIHLRRERISLHLNPH